MGCGTGLRRGLHADVAGKDLVFFAMKQELFFGSATRIGSGRMLTQSRRVLCGCDDVLHILALDAAIAPGK